jgi:hypothetical protein
MTTPITIVEIVPEKWKTIVGLIGSLLAFIIPLALSVSDTLPPPWPFVIGIVVTLATGLGIYKAPYKPKDTTLAPKGAVNEVPKEAIAPAKGDPPDNLWA